MNQLHPSSCLARVVLLGAVLVFAGCDLGGISSAPADAGVDHPPPSPDGGIVLPPEFGVLLAPRLGDLGDPGQPVAVAGLHSQAGAAITVEVLASGAWTAVAQTTAASVPAVGLLPDGGDGDARYAFEVSFDPAPYWVKGGLLHVRARDADNILIDFFHDSDRCLGTVNTWRERSTACGEFLDRGVVLASADGDPDGLTGREVFLDDKGAIDAAQTDAYYAAVDAPPTLAEFRSRYLQRDEQIATYYNAGDLGIGREMHCGHFTDANGDGTGCAVSNYGQFGGLEADALLDAVSGRLSGVHRGAFATVAMIQHGPIEAPNSVQFFVYDATDTLLNRALLDTHGDNQAIPNNCMSCHASNSTYDPATRTISGARFLPFDPDAFSYADVDGFRRADQEADLRALNAIVYDAGASAATQELIRGFYGGLPSATTQAADTSFVPYGWHGQLGEHVYREAVAPYCRGCHVSRGIDVQRESLDFSISDQILSRADTVAAVVCTEGNGRVHRMPDAEVTQHRFWSGPARAYLAALIDLPAACTAR